MFGKSRNQNQLQPPPIAESDPHAVEVLRVWAAPSSPQQLTLRTTWKDAGAWGLMLVDIARHASKAYASEGQDPNSIPNRPTLAAANRWPLWIKAGGGIMKEK